MLTGCPRTFGGSPIVRVTGGSLALLVIFPLILFLMLSRCDSAQADEGPPPPQQHSAEACGEDSSCLRLWYAEYKDAIIQELLFWRQFENDVADRNSLGALNDIKGAIEQRQYTGVSIKEPRFLASATATAILRR
jgi:hypothetical protein